MENLRRHRGIVPFIWNIRLVRIILITLLLVVITAVAVKLFAWPRLSLAPVIFVGLVIPLQLLMVNSRHYFSYNEWENIKERYAGKMKLIGDRRTYIKNYWPWAEVVKMKNTFKIEEMPLYDFERADTLESDDMIIIYGQSDYWAGGMFGRLNTRPFAIAFTNAPPADPMMYFATFVSRTGGNEFEEITFIDDLVGTKNPITIRIYRPS